MADHLKVPLNKTLPRYVQQGSTDSIQVTARSLPCTIKAITGQIVTVSFQVSEDGITLPPATMPVATSQYALAPLQPGDSGMAVPSDAYMGGITGLGGGVASFTQRGNLSTLMFVPVANKSFTTPDPNAFVITGVGTSGVVLRSGDKTVTLTLTASGIVLHLNGNTLNAVDGDVVATGISLLHHFHTNGNDGEDTGPPVPGS